MAAAGSAAGDHDVHRGILARVVASRLDERTGRQRGQSGTIRH